MAETITEMILPGTYIEVRAEGLLSGGLISTGNVGIVGTAEKGDDRIATLASFDDARARYGDATAWDPAGRDAGDGHLVRAARYVFDNGASTLYAKRVYDPDPTHTDAPKPAELLLAKEDGSAGLTLRARTPG